MMRRWSAMVAAVLVAWCGVAEGQTVVFSETFTVADQILLNGNFTFDNDWNFSSSGPGPDIVSGELVTFSGTLWDAGTFNDPFTLDPSTQVITVEFDFTVNTIGTGLDFFGVQLFDNLSSGTVDIFINTSAAANDVLIQASDNAFDSDSVLIGGPGDFTAATSYHFTGVFKNGNSLNGTISIVATAGPGGDVVNNQAVSLNVDGFNMEPIRTLGLVGSEGLTFDNLTITTVPAISATPTMNYEGAIALALLMTIAGGIGLRRRRTGLRSNA